MGEDEGEIAMNLSEMMHKTLHGKRYRVKNRVYIKPKYRRDARGRFVGGYSRRGYWRTILDKKSPKVTNMQLMAENIENNNALFRRLTERKWVVSEGAR